MSLKEIASWKLRKKKWSLSKSLKFIYCLKSLHLKENAAWKRRKKKWQRLKKFLYYQFDWDPGSQLFAGGSVAMSTITKM